MKSYFLDEMVTDSIEDWIHFEEEEVEEKREQKRKRRRRYFDHSYFLCHQYLVGRHQFCPQLVHCVVKMCPGHFSAEHPREVMVGTEVGLAERPKDEVDKEVGRGEEEEVLG